MHSRAGIRSLLAAGFLLTAALPLSAQTTRNQAPKNATAKCGDGTYSKAKHEQGACSRHGGVAQWFGSTEATAQPAPQDQASAIATVRCADSTYSASKGRGTCSSHGGIAERSPAATKEPSTTTSSSTNTVQDSAAVTGASARCKDGTYSHSVHRSGTCSRHGGVAAWLHRPGQD